MGGYSAATKASARPTPWERGRCTTLTTWASSSACTSATMPARARAHPGLYKKVFDKQPPNSEPELRAVFDKCKAKFGTGLLVVDQPASIGAELVHACCCRIPVAEQGIRSATALHPGSKASGCGRSTRTPMTRSSLAPAGSAARTSRSVPAPSNAGHRQRWGALRPSVPRGRDASGHAAPGKPLGGGLRYRGVALAEFRGHQRRQPEPPGAAVVPRVAPRKS